MIVTFGEVMDRDLWMEFCRITGTNEWCMNEGLATEATEYDMTDSQFRQLVGWEESCKS